MKSKKQMTEEDIKNKFITPSIVNCGWNIQSNVFFEHNFTDGRIIVRGNLTTRAKRKKTDYLLMHKKNFPIAIIEAKDNNHSIGSGMQQAIEYAEILDVPFTYSSNGDGFLEHDMLTGKERELTLNNFPSPESLWSRYENTKNLNETQVKMINEPYYFQLGEKTPRYYHHYRYHLERYHHNNLHHVLLYTNHVLGRLHHNCHQIDFYNIVSYSLSSHRLDLYNHFLQTPYLENEKSGIRHNTYPFRLS